MKVLNKTTLNRLCVTLGLCTLIALNSYADDAGASGAAVLSAATTTIRQYVEPAQKLIYAIAAVVALGGAISVFIKMNNEEQDVKKSIMLLIGACVFLVVAATSLPLFFK